MLGNCTCSQLSPVLQVVSEVVLTLICRQDKSVAEQMYCNTN